MAICRPPTEQYYWYIMQPKDNYSDFDYLRISISIARDDLETITYMSGGDVSLY